MGSAQRANGRQCQHSGVRKNAQELKTRKGGVTVTETQWFEQGYTWGGSGDEAEEEVRVGS
jgi:hypothetical protein